MKVPVSSFIIALSVPFMDPISAQTLQTVRGEIPIQAARLHAISALPGNTTLDLIIGLPVRSPTRLYDDLKQIYDPTSPRYRHFLTPGQYNELYGPSPAAFQSVLNFARNNNLKIVNAPQNRKFVHVRAPASVVNAVFHVKLQQYQHPTEKRLFYAPDTEPSIRLETPISHVSGLDNFHAPGRFPVRNVSKNGGGSTPQSAGGSGPSGTLTGKDFRAAYAPGVTLTGRGQTVGILELNGYNASDIQAYENASGFPNVSLQNVYLDGYAGGSPNLESAADIELVISMAPGLSKALVYGAPYNNAGVHDILNEMANPSQGEPLPYQISTSYYFFYDQNVYDALHQLAAQGQALFVASGDYGSYDEVNGTGAFPPADHPYVTSVGATVLQTTGPGGQWISETTASFSGGGRSPWGGGDPQFAIPSWQQGVDYNPSGGSTTIRNAPDVAIVGQDISIYFNGGWSGFAGTSASAPLWAGFMALVNEQAAAAGRPRVGFADPAIWALGKSSCGGCFHDITTGNNFNAINPGKYAAVPGYDLATGWGSPNGSSLINAMVEGISGWGVLPGGGTTSLPDAAAVFQNRLFLFAIGTNDHRHYMNVFDGTAWSGWSQVPGGGTTSLADAAAVLQNKLFLFAIGTNDHRHYVNSFDGASWSGWSQVPGGGTTSLADAAAVFQNKLFLFAIGTNDHRHYMNIFDGTAWSGWRLVPGGGTTSLSDTAAVLQNRLYLFAVGTNDHKHYVNSFDGASWSGWSQVPGGGTTSLADAAAAFQSKLYLFAIGTNDHHHYMNIFDGMAWSGWRQPAADGKTALPDAAVAFGSHLYLFAIGINDHQHYMLPAAP